MKLAKSKVLVNRQNNHLWQKLSILLCLVLITFSGCKSQRCETENQKSSENTAENFEEPKHETRMLSTIQKKYHFSGSQDGAIFGDTMFTFGSKGKGTVYRYSDAYQIGRVNIKGNVIPHVNSACFSDYFFEETDAFPLIYLCVYNNYSDKEDRLLGTCMVYRLSQEKATVELEPVQAIRIGFTDDELWTSGNDSKPYGNFLVNNDTNELYAFTIQDDHQLTRFFKFKLPEPTAGEYDEIFGCPLVTLTKDDILDSFDLEFSTGIQGACLKDGRIYSAEGFGTDLKPGLIRVIDLAEKKTVQIYSLDAVNLTTEPEFIDFCGNTLVYGDGKADFYEISFLDNTSGK